MSWEPALAHVAALSSGAPLDPGLRVTVHFHPDRIFAGEPILAAMARDGIYRSQFETGTGNGALNACPGGDRWRWESRMFGGAYDTASPSTRPKYGSLNHRRRATGGSPRFGSAHLRMRRETLERTTFCYPDSYLEPTDFGVASRMALIDLAEADEQDYLDDYIEAHVHGTVRFATDVEALVLDPCYADTAVADLAAALACPIEWHQGFVLSVDEFRRQPDYRGPEVIEAGLEIAQDGRLDARIVGVAVNAGTHDPQTLKRVWHHVARFGGHRAV
ncbi:DUF3626 domain-containing protein [Asanoa iriomotensis]|uniref:DUF3626 domain-containing protein n=1 Tax=Asanoa iriomotensis TaxID=234613 RepID=A0ABQ4C2B4_9ACTN|nr:DUF3626 domain-containing protein [Asanoa iriomotensis]GIF56918.1 hypothetical protein Air01nite_30130 [Asanoa iriomotensis]